jgi:hypothetical protein
MSDFRDERLDAMLRARRIEPANPDLAERIVQKAQGIAQNRPISFMGWWRQLFADFHLPRPAYVFACTLILGFVIGFYLPVNITKDQPDTIPVQSFLYADEDVL